MDRKKRQHYVWKNYLNAWSDKNMLYTLFKDINEIKYIPTISLAFETDFYKITDIDKDSYDFLLLYSLISKCDDDTKKLISASFSAFNILQSLSVENINFNLVEDFHNKIENIALNIFPKLKINDLSFIDNDSHDVLYFYIFLCFQYFRTRKMRDILKETIRDDNINMIYSLVLSIKFARSLYQKKFFHYSFINETNTPFITSDQPVINLAKDTNNTDELKLYYPLSSNTAYLLSRKSLHNEEEKISDDKNDKIETLILKNEKDVVAYNDYISNLSYKYIYANSRSILERYKYQK